METTRRKLFSLLGLGGAALATSSVVALAVDKAVEVAPAGGSTTAFRFQCFCGDSVVAAVPDKSEAATCVVNCPTCHHGYTLTWHGTHFSFSDHWVRASADDDFQLAGPVLSNKQTYEEIAESVLSKGQPYSRR